MKEIQIDVVFMLKENALNYIKFNFGVHKPSFTSSVLAWLRQLAAKPCYNKNAYLLFNFTIIFTMINKSKKNIIITTFWLKEKY